MKEHMYIIGGASFFSKTKEKLIIKLALIFVLSIITMLVFIEIKIKLDTIYTEEKFAEFYETSGLKKYKRVEEKEIISFGTSGLKLTDTRQKYIDESMTAYKFFGCKSMCISILYIIVIGFNIAMLIKNFKIKEKYDRLSRDDEILFDDVSGDGEK